MENIIMLLANKYNFNYDEAIKYINTCISTKIDINTKIDTNTNTDINTETNVDTNTNNEKKYSLTDINFQLPYYGVIREECCKGIIFNSGLYTQCKVETKLELCKSCSANKYGIIYEREKYSIGNFVCKNGKKEKNYITYLKNNNIDIEYVKNLFEYNNINFEIKIEKKTRGRPKQEKGKKVKIEEESSESRVEEEECKIEGKEYIKSGSIIEDRLTREIIGILKDG